jgi:hypothetical protein
MVVNIEDAGFEIRDVVSWIYSGFPKSLNVSKNIDKMDAGKLQLARRLSFCKWLRATGVAVGAVTRVLRDSGLISENGTMAGHYFATSEAGQPAIMTREHLEACRHLFSEVPQWVKDECDKRSVESENFKSREVVGSKKAVNTKKHRIAYSVSAEGFDKTESHIIDITAPATDAAKQWDGWGTALKPACEFFTLCRKPLSEKTIAANVLKWGTGGINIDGCRVGSAVNTKRPCGKALLGTFEGQEGKVSGRDDVGRFPANLIHDCSPEVLDGFPEAGDKSPSRFFYCPKASKKDRDEGLEGLGGVKTNDGRKVDADNAFQRGASVRKNSHPTVKPTALMAYLCRLITPPGGVVLDPYMGSGSTGKAAVREGFGFVGCELDPDYFKIATARVENEQHQPDEQTKQSQPDEQPALETVELSFNF